MATEPRGGAGGDGERAREPHRARLAGAIYGQILTTSVVAGFGESSEIGSLTICAAVIGTAVVFWVSHAYAEVVSENVIRGRSLPWHELREILGRSWPIVQSGVPATIVLLLSALGAYSTATAVDLAIGVGVVSLFLWGAVIGRSAGVSLGTRLLIGLTCAAFGLIVVVLKVLVH